MTLCTHAQTHLCALVLSDREEPRGLIGIMMVRDPLIDANPLEHLQTTIQLSDENINVLGWGSNVRLNPSSMERDQALLETVTIPLGEEGGGGGMRR